jgi:hypothetical protein
LGTLIYGRDWANFSPVMVERLTDSNLVAWPTDRRHSSPGNDHEPRRRSLHWIGSGDDLVAAYYSTGIRTYLEYCQCGAACLCGYGLAANGLDDS